MNKDFSPMSDISLKIEYYLFGEDTIIKIIDDDEYYFDKITEEWSPSQFMDFYKKKNILPRKITEEQSKMLISRIINKSSNNKQEIDFNFIEDLVTEKRNFIITDNKTNKVFEIKEAESHGKKKLYIGLFIVILLLTIGNTFTIFKYLGTKNEKPVETLKIENITLKNIVIVKNTPLPNQYSSYIEEKIPQDATNNFIINTENVDITVPGIYTYSIKYDNKEYIGAVIVVNNENEKNQTIDQLQNPSKYSE